MPRPNLKLNERILLGYRFAKNAHPQTCPRWSGITLVLLLALSLASEAERSKAWAWGGGHTPQTRLIFENLPLEIRTNFSSGIVSDALSTWCFEPDAHKQPFKVALIGQAALARLKEQGILYRSDLHSDQGRAMAFALLVDAFRETNYAHVAYWTSVLSHSTGDMAAENHNPAAHYTAWAWDPFDVKLSSGVAVKKLSPLLDLKWTTDSPAGMKAAQNWVQAHLLADDGRDGQAALLDVMLRGCSGSALLSRVGTPLVSDASAWVDRQEPGAQQRVWQGMAQLAGWGANEVIRDVLVAKRLAAEGAVLRIQPSLLQAYEQAKRQHLRQFPLANDSLFGPLLRTNSAAGSPAVGIVFEPTWQMNESMLGYGDKVIATAIARTLAQSHQRYLTLDLRTVLAQGFPSPRQMPGLILSASLLQNYEGMLKSDLDRRLKTYLDQGGKLIWVGGSGPLPSASMGHIQKAMTRNPGEWPVLTKEFASFRLTLHGSRPAAWPLLHDVSTTGGWQKPTTPFYFGSPTAGGLEPLLSLTNNEKDVTIAVTWAKGAYLPLFTLAPFVYSNDKIADAGQPVLDQVGRAILMATFAKLRLPDFTGPNQ
jgi:hypothetical protein